MLFLSLVFFYHVGGQQEEVHGHDEGRGRLEVRLEKREGRAKLCLFQ